MEEQHFSCATCGLGAPPAIRVCRAPQCGAGFHALCSGSTALCRNHFRLEQGLPPLPSNPPLPLAANSCFIANDDSSSQVSTARKRPPSSIYAAAADGKHQDAAVNGDDAKAVKGDDEVNGRPYCKVVKQRKEAVVVDNQSDLPEATWQDDFEADFIESYLNPVRAVLMFKEHCKVSILFRKRNLLYGQRIDAAKPPPLPRPAPRLRILIEPKGFSCPCFACLCVFIQRENDLACAWASTLGPYPRTNEGAKRLSVLTDLEVWHISRPLPPGFRHLLVLYHRNPYSALDRAWPWRPITRARYLQLLGDDEAGWAAVDKTSFSTLAASLDLVMFDLTDTPLELVRQVFFSPENSIDITLQSYAVPRRAEKNSFLELGQAGHAARVVQAKYTELQSFYVPRFTEFRFPFGPEDFAVRMQRVDRASCAFCGARFDAPTDLAVHLALMHVSFCGEEGHFDLQQGRYGELVVTVRRCPRPKRRKVCALPAKMQYHCPLTMAPLTACDVFCGYRERQNDVDDAWYHMQRMELLENEFADITPKEKTVMKLWNAHMATLGPSAMTRQGIQDAVTSFCQDSDNRATLKNCRTELLAHMLSLVDAGKIEAVLVARLLAEL